jgi:hypothetical protein
MKVPENAHRHSHSSESSKNRLASHRKNSSNCSSASNSTLKSVEMNLHDEQLAVVDEEFYENKSKDLSFLKVIGEAIANIDLKPENSAAIDTLVMNIAELENRDKVMMQRILNEMMKICINTLPDKQLFNS